MELFAHQRAGAAWLAQQARAGLFDEQGLGKTATALVAAATHAADGPLLVVVPTAVTHNWARECRMWVPQLGEPQILRTGRDRPRQDRSVVIVSHGMLLQEPVYAALRAIAWSTVILDEAHFFRKPTAKRTRRFYGMQSATGARNDGGLVSRAKRCWVLTGTPMPNNPTELWAMLAGLAPQRIGRATDPSTPVSWYAFRQRFCELGYSAYTPDKTKVTGAKNTQELRDRMKGFAMRRLKSEHLDLPALRYGSTTITLDQMPAGLRDIERELGVRAGMTPSEILDRLRDSVHFSAYRRLCGDAKATAAVELLGDELDEDLKKKLVVFAHHTSVVDTIVAGLDRHNPIRIAGDTPASVRQQLVDRFQSDPTCRVAVCNIVAGGVGITLTAASDAVMVEQSWVPADNAQAAMRIHRIGQTQPVLVRFLSLADSIDELISDALRAKTEMIRAVGL